MSMFITKQAEIDGIEGMLRTALTQTMLDGYRTHHALMVSSEDKFLFAMKVTPKVMKYVEEKLTTEESLNEVSDFYHYLTYEITPGLRNPEVLYGVTGWKEFDDRMPQINFADARYVKKELAWRALVCLALDYVRQERYLSQWNSMEENARAAAC